MELGRPGAQFVALGAYGKADVPYQWHSFPAEADVLISWGSAPAEVGVLRIFRSRP